MTLSERLDAALAERLDAVLHAAVDERRIVGGVIWVARDGVVVARRALGLADREAGTPMRDDALFRVASLTKPIVAATTLALVGQGKLRLDDPVTRFLPGFRPTFAGAEVPLSIQQLLTHTSGLAYSFLEPPDGPLHRAGVSDALDGPGRSADENLARLATVPLAFRPGSAFLYSLAYDVLGEAIARAGDAPLPELVARLVTRPLGLVDTAFSVGDRARLVTPYADGSPEPRRMTDGIFVPFGEAGATFAPSRILDPKSYPSGGAGMVGTGGEFLRFLEALRRREGLVPTSLVDAMLADRIAPITSPILGDGWGFGLGAAILRDPVVAQSSLRRGAARWGGAYGHTWFVDPETKTSAVLLTNTAFEGMAGKVRDDFQRAVTGP